ncbi:tRNA (adenosine(37)-N6)-threonylcarbamoyltransferase complex dimerization subunit type 1 TsaB [Candidatus Aerophobetes bacterium]|uniref:tRNA (Adenosine(37)-N6)-threonylcarbamoyltransferase complex dimerization subunit type 1 TsaB n=1 Tax=Aerophobetes bacterium TaxID=2030807 RepID=A0A2A4X786_UNCAE|nr:MAG: tRNA (adenosine(37)-N6)-threonylcarbamoyltransferase complex dimerization subunit type 1 TsaB [Candidatus Aerophobetes bacterium]
MNYLIIETSISQSFLLLYCEGKQSIALLGSRSQASQITEKIQELIEQTDIALSSLNFIAIGTGPGSFTGSRVGVLVAKTLNYALNIPLVSYCSLINLFPAIDIKSSKTPSSLLLIGDAKSRGFSTLEANLNQPHLFKDKRVLVQLEEIDVLKQTHLLCFDSGIDLEKKGLDSSQIPFFLSVEPNYTFIRQYCQSQFSKGATKTHTDVQVEYAFSP